ncbi:unnamed protein product [Lactuca virosa]|uniref:Uncharacterized protein n=1 Tax=Lactuca virosa TaxID=75947 RepID=A0AAU9LJG9_9ASTR|nr:unnamed protein product [Lactuca virosa]
MVPWLGYYFPILLPLLLQIPTAHLTALAIHLERQLHHKTFDSRLRRFESNPLTAIVDSPERSTDEVDAYQPIKKVDFQIQYKEKHPNNNFVPIPNKPFVFIGPAIRNRFSFPALSPTLSITKS